MPHQLTLPVPVLHPPNHPPTPPQNYQLRIAYATYQLVQRMPGGERHVAFTRILHRTAPDHAQARQAAVL